ncbi:ATP-binding cassette domain-containing protein [Halobacterium sp. KA-4]|uniref:ATP-binding cassette domain-containing protein n=1 Tax=Halobacterium sp. KA-4 TaxID=2896367 RepID=UPI002E7B8909|nr:ATP-binding cassette domain-containing protein [Halobacterium sp. KA-4]
MTLDVRDVDVELGGTQILDAVSAAVGDGRLVGVVGPNGAGKSTLLRAMNGVVEPVAGSVLVDDEAVHELPSKAASRRIASVPQDTSLGFEFTVRETVEMGRHAHVPRFGSDPDPEAVERAMERAEVAQFADREVTSLSGGEKQRVLLARALAQQAPVLLLDEPTASLDVNHQVRTLELVRGLADDADRAVVAAIHDLDLAARYCDELVLVADGRVLDSGRPEDVLTPEQVREAFDARVAVGTDPATGDPTVTPLPDTEGDLAERVHVLGGGDAATPILRELADAGATVTVGPVSEGSLDHETATRFGFEAVTVPPFSTPDDAAVSRARDLVGAADAVVVAGDAVSWGANETLRDAADAAVVVGDAGPRTVAGARVELVSLVDALAALDVEPEPFAVADGGNVADD